MAASTFLFHPLMNEVVPYNASYQFPSQATRSTKRTVKVTPKNNASSYLSGSTIRFEFPASGYLNPSNTYLSFNCRAKINSGSFVAGTTGTQYGGFEFQQNIASIFRRVRVLYGSLVLEDIQDYNILQRLFTDTLSKSGGSYSDTAMFQGIGRSVRISAATSTGYHLRDTLTQDRHNYHSLEAAGVAPTEVGTTVRRYCIPINTGVFQQKRLIPLKFMSSQLQIEFEIADAVDSQIWVLGVGGTPAIPTATQTEVGLAELTCELLEFDAEFDSAVFTGLSNGLAIPFQSWHMTSQNIQPGTSFMINIQESSRSVRYALAAVTDDAFRTLDKDAHKFLNGMEATQASAVASSTDIQNNAPLVTQRSFLDSYQWRLGGTYYPSQPVPVYGSNQVALVAANSVDAAYADPPVEAHAELMKVFDNQFGRNIMLGDSDYGIYSCKRNTIVGTNTGNVDNFVIGVDFLTDRGDVIGGINAEEQNDLMLLLKFNAGATNGTAKVVRIAVCYDNIMILGESNNMVLVN